MKLLLLLVFVCMAVARFGGRGGDRRHKRDEGKILNATNSDYGNGNRGQSPVQSNGTDNKKNNEPEHNEGGIGGTSPTVPSPGNGGETTERDVSNENSGNSPTPPVTIQSNNLTDNNKKRSGGRGSGLLSKLLGALNLFNIFG